MATRGPAGQLIAAWNEPNCRHGSLSSPTYLDYLLSSCKVQIDAGADYLFMDEIPRPSRMTKGSTIIRSPLSGSSLSIVSASKAGRGAMRDGTTSSRSTWPTRPSPRTER